MKKSKNTNEVIKSPTYTLASMKRIAKALDVAKIHSYTDVKTLDSGKELTLIIAEPTRKTTRLKCAAYKLVRWLVVNVLK